MRSKYESEEPSREQPDPPSRTDPSSHKGLVPTWSLQWYFLIRSPELASSDFVETAQTQIDPSQLLEVVLKMRLAFLTEVETDCGLNERWKFVAPYCHKLKAKKTSTVAPKINIVFRDFR